MNVVAPRTSEDTPKGIALSIMHRANFTSDLIWRTTIWAAKGRDCPECLVPAGYACHNMADVKKGPPHYIRRNRWPHEQRVDYDLLVRTLKQRGYS